MIRKPLYLKARQDKALKRRARELGVSEAEVGRRALDTALSDEAVSPTWRRNRELLQVYCKEADELTKDHSFPLGYRFDRQALYEEDERFKRWGR